MRPLIDFLSVVNSRGRSWCHRFLIGHRLVLFWRGDYMLLLSIHFLSLCWANTFVSGVPLLLSGLVSRIIFQCLSFDLLSDYWGGGSLTGRGSCFTDGVSVAIWTHCLSTLVTPTLLPRSGSVFPPLWCPCVMLMITVVAWVVVVLSPHSWMLGVLSLNRKLVTFEMKNYIN
jgi:hypothetical protein